MKIFLSFFFKYILSPRVSSLIRPVSIVCIFGLIVSIASLVVVISVMSGFGSSLKDRLLSHEPHLVVYKDSSQNMNLLDQVQKILAQSRLDNDIQSIRSFETQDIILKNSEGHFAGAIARGYGSKDLRALTQGSDEKYFEDVNSKVEWDSSNIISIKKDKVRIHIGVELADQLSAYEGDFVFIMPAESLLTPPTDMAPPEEVQIDSLIFSVHSYINNKKILYEKGSIVSLQETASLSQGVEIFLKDPAKYKPYKEILKTKGFDVQSWSDQNSSLFFALKIEKIIMTVFLALAALIAGFSIASMIQLLMTQQRQDIGILMVMGYPVRQVRKLFVHLAFMMSFLGVSSGVLLGYLICIFLKFVPIDLLPSIYVDRKIPVIMQTEVFVGVFILAGLLAYIISLVSVRFYTLSSIVNLLLKKA